MQKESRRIICAFYSVSSVGLQLIAGVYRHVAQGHLWDVTYLRHWDFADPARLAAGQARRVFKSATGLTLRAFRQPSASHR